MKLHRLFGVTLVVVSVGVAPAFAQEGPKGGGGAGGGGGNGGGGGSSVNGVSGGGNSPGAPSGGGGGGGSSFGGGGGGGSMSPGGGSDFSSFRGSRDSNGAINRGEGRAAEPSYARAVAPGSRSAGSTSNAVNGGRSRGDRPSLGVAIERERPADRPSRGGGGISRLDPFQFGYGNYGLAYNTCGYGYNTFGYGYNTYSRCNDPFYSGYGYYGLGSMFYDPYLGIRQRRRHAGPADQRVRRTRRAAAEGQTQQGAGLHRRLLRRHR